jgi:hypothetical protein
MSSILDGLASPEVKFRPRSISEFFALQLARKVGSTHRLGVYLTLVERHGRAEILTALARARKHTNGTQVADRFEDQLRKLTSRQ